MAETTTATVTITVDGVEYQVPAGMWLIDAITEYVHFDMPRFCHHSRLEPVGMCRMCMAEVEARGRWANVATCTVRVADGLQVRVNSAAAVQARQMTLELLLVNHPLDCPVCDKGGECLLQDQTVDAGPEVARTVEPRRKYPKPLPISRYVLLDRERCVQCARCTRFVAEVAGEKTIELINRGYHTAISPAFDGEYDSHFSGNTCDICPVGALTSATFRFRSRPWEMKGQPTISPFDACGSNLRLDVRENVVRRIMPRENRAVNDLWISDRERFHHEVILHPDRLDVPLVRNLTSGKLEPATYEDAVTTAVEGLAQALREGRRVAGVGSTVLGLEEQYAFGKFVRAVLGTNSVTCSKPVDYDARAGLVPTYERLAQARTIFLGAANPLAELPIAWLRLHQAIRGGARLITLNNTDYHVGLLSSLNVECVRGQEALVVKALLAIVQREKRHDATAIRKHSHGLSEAAPSWVDTDLDAVAATAGVPVERLQELARELASAEDLVIVSPQCDGRPDGTALREGLWNLALLLDVPGQANGGWLEYVHNCNGRGAAAMGLRPDLLPGLAPVTDAAARAAFEAAWGVPLPSDGGLDTAGLLAAAAAGELGALVVIGSDLVSDEGNPFQTVRNQWLNQSHDGDLRATFEADWARRRAAVDQVPFVVVSDLFLTETAKLADVVFPATCFAERTATYQNFEGRVQHAPSAVRPILGVRSDLDVINALATGVAARLEQPPTWQPLDPAAAMAEIRALVPRYAVEDGAVVKPAAGKFEFAKLA